jgi:hypothetical protein
LDSSIILFTRSVDQGLTWSTPVRISKRAGDCIDSDNTVEGAVPAVGPEGQIYVSWAGPLGLTFNYSEDEGLTWPDTNIILTDIPGGWDYNIPGINRANGLPVTCCDLSNGPYNGNIYINWSDQRNGVSDTDIWFKKSTDGGQSWGPNQRVNDDQPGKQQFFTWMTIDQVTGIIYIIFYDRRNYPDTQTDVYLAVSSDGGATFENMRISQAPFIPNNCPTGYNFFGDYTHISAHNNIVRPIWATCDNSNQSIKIAIIDSLFTNSVTWTGNQTANWNSPWNWNPRMVPGAAQDVIIPQVSNNRYPKVNVNGLSCNNITINENATLTIPSNITLTINGTVDNQNEP